MIKKFGREDTITDFGTFTLFLINYFVKNCENYGKCIRLQGVFRFSVRLLVETSL